MLFCKLSADHSLTNNINCKLLNLVAISIIQKSNCYQASGHKDCPFEMKNHNQNINLITYSFIDNSFEYL
jgi:hypothetical protein